MFVLSFKGQGYLKQYDPDAHTGRGKAAFTDDPSDAMHFESEATAKSLIYTPSSRFPIRADGKPNLPLTGYDAVFCVPIGLDPKQAGDLVHKLRGLFVKLYQQQAAEDEYLAVLVEETKANTALQLRQKDDTYMDAARAILPGLLDLMDLPPPPAAKPQPKRVRKELTKEARELRDVVRAARQELGNRQSDVKRGYVYVLSNANLKSAEGKVKIGSTLDLDERLATPQTFDPDDGFCYHYSVIVEDREMVEKVCHRYFAKQHYRKEWFWLTPDEARVGIQAVIAAL